MLTMISQKIISIGEVNKHVTKSLYYSWQLLNILSEKKKTAYLQNWKRVFHLLTIKKIYILGF